MTLIKRCIQDAKSYGTELFSCDCLDILEKHYGNRMDYMLEKTIVRKVYDLMGVITDDPDMGEIEYAVTRYMRPL